MTNDELLAGFLDRSLSEDQHLELEARKAASPEFAHQFSNMLTLETMLASATPKAAIPAHFLASVENTVAAKVLVGGASAGGLLSGLSSMWSWLGGAALVLVTAGSIYYFNQPATVAVVQTAQPTVGAQSAEGQTAVAQPSSTVTEPAIPEPQPVSVPSTTTKAAIPAPNVDPATTSTSEMSSTSPEAALASTVKEYEAHVTSSDHLNATLKAITIGRTYRSTNDLGRSEDYFAKAVVHARKAKLAEQEITALGEQAVTVAARGNETQARLLLNQAISRGSQTGIDVSVWTQKLKDLR